MVAALFSMSLSLSDFDLRLYTKLLQVIRMQSTKQMGCLLIDIHSANIMSYGYEQHTICAEMIMLQKLSWIQKVFSRHYVCLVSHMPCLSCSQKLVKCGIRQVYYLTPFGDGKGVEYLLSQNVVVKRILLD